MTIQEFAQKVQAGCEERLRHQNLACDANMTNAKTQIKQGRKWTRVDRGYSGKYMIDQQGNIYGIKAYGVPHKGYRYGNLENPSPRCFDGS